MKRDSEGKFGKALRDVDLPTYVYKIPDVPGPTNFRPCDYLVWFDHGFGEPLSGDARSAWFECKDIDALNSFNLNLIRPAQRRGVDEARFLGVPYWLAIYWRRRNLWTISDMAKVVDTKIWGLVPVSLTFTDLSARYGIDSSPAQLAMNLKAVLLGEAG